MFSLKFSQPNKEFGEIPSGTPSEVFQCYPDTCAIRSQEIILRDFGINVSQEKLITQSAAHGWYDGNGTAPEDVGKLLELHGIPIRRHENANIFNLVSELAQGHKVIVAVDSFELWGQADVYHDIGEFMGHQTPDHALVVSSIDTTNPNDVKITVTDPGTGEVAKVYSQKEFLDAWADSNYFMVTTTEPAPATLPAMSGFDYVQGHLDHFMGMAYDNLSTLCNQFMDMPVGEMAAQFGDSAASFIVEHPGLVARVAIATGITYYGGDPTLLTGTPENLLTEFVDEVQEHFMGQSHDQMYDEPVLG